MERSDSEWKSKHPELVSGFLSLQPTSVHGPGKLCLSPCALFWLHLELGFLD